MVRITQATEQDFPHVRSLFLEYVQWLILMVETIWEYPVAITPVELVERDMADVQKFMPPDGRLLLAAMIAVWLAVPVRGQFAWVLPRSSGSMFAPRSVAVEPVGH